MPQKISDALLLKARIEGMDVNFDKKSVYKLLPWSNNFIFFLLSAGLVFYYLHLVWRKQLFAFYIQPANCSPWIVIHSAEKWGGKTASYLLGLHQALKTTALHFTLSRCNWLFTCKHFKILPTAVETLWLCLCVSVCLCVCGVHASVPVGF